MPWWGWLFQIIGMVLLAVSAACAVFNTLRRKPLATLSYLVSGLSSLVAGAFFVLLNPKPPVYGIALASIAGVATGVCLSFAVHLQIQGGQVFSSHGHLHLAAWSFLLLISSILAVSGTAAARVSAALALSSSLAVAGYSAVFYIRCR